MMKKTALFTLLLLPLMESRAQYVKIDNGLMTTAYADPIGLGIMDGRTAHYAVNLGIDYMEKKWFYLSSQIGYAKIGGTDEFNDPEPSTIQEIKNYLHFNTTIRAFQRKDALTWFAGIGPYYNLRIDGPSFTSADYKDFYKAKSYLGGRAEAGFHFDVSKIRFGLTGTYLYSFTHAAKTSAIGLKNNNLGFFASIGYKI